MSALDLDVGDLVLVEAGDLIPGDGEVVEGIASVNEAAITGESAPVIRESGGDRSAVTGGTTVISDWLVVRITAAPGSSFLDRMIALVEGAERQKTPNEIALNVLLAGMTIVFLIAVVTLSRASAAIPGADVPVPVLVALLVTLIPTTIGGLLSAIGIAGMDRLIRFNVLAMSGRAVEAAGDVDTLLLDKTGTITFGNRMASEIIPVSGVTEREAAEAALLASLADETAEGRSIVALVAGKIRPAGSGPVPGRMPASSSSPRPRGSPASTSATGSCARERSTPCSASCATPADEASRIRASPPPWTASPARAEPLLGWPTEAGCWASSISRTWSSPTSRSASPNCAAWASAPSW